MVFQNCKFVGDYREYQPEENPHKVMYQIQLLRFVSSNGPFKRSLSIIMQS